MVSWLAATALVVMVVVATAGLAALVLVLTPAAMVMVVPTQRRCYHRSVNTYGRLRRHPSLHGAPRLRRTRTVEAAVTSPALRIATAAAGAVH